MWGAEAGCGAARLLEEWGDIGRGEVHLSAAGAKGWMARALSNMERLLQVAPPSHPPALMLHTSRDLRLLCCVLRSAFCCWRGCASACAMAGACAEGSARRWEARRMPCEHPRQRCEQARQAARACAV
eukprot:1860267-Rhodomonas_salina.1